MQRNHKPTIRIINLDDIVTLNINKRTEYFQNLIQEKKKDTSTETAALLIDKYNKQTLEIIDAFNHGKIDEISFINPMLKRFSEITGVEISTEALKQAWQTMHPAFEQFAVALEHAIQYNQKPTSEIIFISSSNPIDSRNLIKELEKTRIPHKVNNCGQLTEINQIKLYSTCTEKMTKEKLIERIVKELYASVATNSSLGTNSFTNIFNEEQPVHRSDIKYIRRVDAVTDDVLYQTQRSDTSGENYYMVDTILWEQHVLKNTSLEEVLSSHHAREMKISAARL